MSEIANAMNHSFSQNFGFFIDTVKLPLGMIICADGVTLTGQSTMSLANPTNLSWMTPQNGAWITAWLQMLIDLQQYTLPTSTHVLKHHFS